MAKIPEGSVERYTLEKKSIEGVSLESAAWEIRVKAWKEIVIEKKDAIDNGDGTYDFFVDTALTGRGELRAVLSVSAPDSDYPQGLRKVGVLVPIVDKDGEPDVVV